MTGRCAGGPVPGAGYAAVRRSFAVAVSVLSAPALPGCAGFLVPAGESEPAPASGPTATSPPSSGAPAASTPPAAGSGATEDCPVSGARVGMGHVQTAMFHRAVTLTLTNCGKKPYRVHGHPSGPWARTASGSPSR